MVDSRAKNLFIGFSGSPTDPEKVEYIDRKAIAELFEKKFKDKYSLHTISKILRDRGLVLRRPAKFSVKRDQSKVDLFRDETYQDIKKEVEEDGGTIAFIDETLVKQNSNTLRGFSPKGVAPCLQHYTETSSHGIGSLIIGFTLIGLCYIIL